NTSITNTLSANARLGLLSTGTVTVDPAIAQIFPLMPLPNAGLLGSGDTGQYISLQDSPSKGRYVLGKIDHQLSTAGSLNGSFFTDDADTSSPDGFHNKRTAKKTKKVMVSTEYTRINNPTLVSVSRIGFSRSATVSGVITDVYNPLLND